MTRVVQLLNRNPKHRLGADRDAEELKEHPFFASIDWKALSMKQVTPPFKPVVESDESTVNFDPEFTTADLREFGVDENGDENRSGSGSRNGGSPDESDPSDEWTHKLPSVAALHTPHGPLGSERPWPNAAAHGVNGLMQGIQIRKRRDDDVDSPLTNSVQENFRGFTYSGGESFVAPDGFAGGKEEEEVVDEEEENEPTTEDEYEDEKFVGRYSSRGRRYGDED